MDTHSLRQFDLHFPGHWIEGPDRDWAYENQHLLSLIQTLFREAVAAYSMFRPPVILNTIEEILQQRENESPYEGCLNSIYAKAFVFALDGIQKLLSRLCEFLEPPQDVKSLVEEYEKEFGHHRYVRDSAIHIEDRGRGMKKPSGRVGRRSQERVPANIFLLGCLKVTTTATNYCFTGEDGKQHEVEISEAELLKAKRIIQAIIYSYPWVPDTYRQIEQIVKQFTEDRDE
jgi:hypothetical protein